MRGEGWGGKESLLHMQMIRSQDDPRMRIVANNQYICCGYSLEVPLGSTSNEYPQHMFLFRNKKKNIWSYTTNYKFNN